MRARMQFHVCLSVVYLCLALVPKDTMDRYLGLAFVVRSFDINSLCTKAGGFL